MFMFFFCGTSKFKTLLCFLEYPFSFCKTYNSKFVIPTSQFKLHTSFTIRKAIKMYIKYQKKLKNTVKVGDFNNELKKLLINKVHYTIDEYLSDRKS